MIVLNDLYDYGLKIYQNTEYFKFSLDSIILAEFVKLKPHARILDIGTGNAAIPLILTTKDDTLKIDGVEIQQEVAELAKNTVKLNNLEKNIVIYNEDAKTYSKDDNYDIITCNPPYFKVTEKTEKNINIVKRVARHEIMFTLEDAIKTAKRLLKSNGYFYLVHRTDRLLDTIKLLELHKFGIRKLVFVFTKQDKNAEFFLIQASKNKKSDVKVTSLNIKNLKTYKNIFEEE